jgi:hypothetical protein
MQPDEVAEVMADPIAQELLQSAIPARLPDIRFARHVSKRTTVRSRRHPAPCRLPRHRLCHSAGLASRSWTSF